MDQVLADSQSTQPALFQHNVLDDPVPPGKKGRARGLAGKYMCFTWNNHQNRPDWELLLSAALDASVRFVAQEETSATGTPHIQGAVQWPARWRPVEKGLLPGAHWELMKARSCGPAKCSAVGGAQVGSVCAWHYCCKADSRTPGGQQWHKGPRLPRPLMKVSKAELRPWQRRIYDELAQPLGRDDRRIRWYWEETGNVGKSFLVKCMVDEGDFTVCKVSGSASDIKFAIKSFTDTNGEGPDVVVCDVPRTNHGGVSYQALEECKNGLLFSPKYESGQCRFNTPHVVVFANVAPDRTQLSADRWYVRELVGFEVSNPQ